MAQALGNRSTLIMANHGALVGAATIEVAILHLLALERACMTEWMVKAAGAEIRRVPVEVAEAVGAMAADGFGEAGYLEGMKAVLDHGLPGLRGLTAVPGAPVPLLERPLRHLLRRGLG